LEAVKKAVAYRQKFTPLIMKLAKESALTGEPIMKSLEYVFPNQGLADVIDQFMLGDYVLVAPMLAQDKSRNVVLPKGKWKADDGKIYKGGQSILLEVSLDRLPYFERMGK